jgi:hypothetical protein
MVTGLLGSTALEHARAVWPKGLCDAPWTRPVGPGWDVVLIPEAIARRAVRALDRVRLDAVGTVFAHHGTWGFFVPEQSDDPEWPDGITYRSAGSTVVLPPLSPGPGSGWVRARHDGRLLTRPLLLHPVVSQVTTTDSSTCPDPCLTSARGAEKEKHRG